MRRFAKRMQSPEPRAKARSHSLARRSDGGGPALRRPLDQPHPSRSRAAAKTRDTTCMPRCDRRFGTSRRSRSVTWTGVRPSSPGRALCWTPTPTRPSLRLRPAPLRAPPRRGNERLACGVRQAFIFDKHISSAYDVNLRSFDNCQSNRTNHQQISTDSPPLHHPSSNGACRAATTVPRAQLPLSNVDNAVPQANPLLDSVPRLSRPPRRRQQQRAGRTPGIDQAPRHESPLCPAATPAGNGRPQRPACPRRDTGLGPTLEEP